MAKKALITGAGGFIGHHLLKFHKNKSEWFRGVDIKYPEFEPTQVDKFELLDLREFESCLIATRGGFDEIYHLAAMLEVCRINSAGRFFFSSSACVYP
jgi:nucleoside-diphosphate-sugar epimerase